MISNGSATTFLITLGPNAPKNGIPYKREIQKVFKQQLSSNEIKLLDAIARKMVHFSRYKKHPYTIPPNIAVRVKPKKYAPSGLSRYLMMSPAPAAIAAVNGPYNIPSSAVIRYPNPIFSVSVKRTEPTNEMTMLIANSIETPVRVRTDFSSCAD